MIVMVDSNVVIDVIGIDQAWVVWSRAMLKSLNVSGEKLVINHVVLAEIAGNAPDLPSLLVLLEDLDIEIMAIEESSAFSAGRAFRDYRRKGVRSEPGSAILSDFLIGAHAETLGARLPTRDVSLYRRHFPSLPLITPETHPHG